MSEGSPAAPSAPQREERKVVTALFADLVGSTALAERLDPEEVKLVVGDAVGRVVTEVDRMAIAEQAAVIPIGYGSNAMVIKPWVSGW